MTHQDAYWLGYRHGKHLGQHDPLTNHEPRLWLELSLAAGRKWKAWALGELRGYRQATDRP